MDRTPTSKQAVVEGDSLAKGMRFCWASLEVAVSWKDGEDRSAVEISTADLWWAGEDSTHPTFTYSFFRATNTRSCRARSFTKEIDS